MSEQKAGAGKIIGLWRWFKGSIVKVYILVVTAALIHLILYQQSEPYREFTREIENSVQDTFANLELPEILQTPEPAPTSNTPPTPMPTATPMPTSTPMPTATPMPIFFSSEEYGGDAFLPVYVLEPGQYRYVVTGNAWMANMEVCGIRGLFSELRARFVLNQPCDLTLTVSGLDDEPWSLTIEPEPDYQETSW